MKRYFMNKLSSTQRSYLRSRFHHLEPVILIGKNEITDGTIESMYKVLEARELIKIKFREYKDEKKILFSSVSRIYRQSYSWDYRTYSYFIPAKS